MDKTENTLPVEQCDRDAAAGAYLKLPGPLIYGTSEEMESGNYDSHWLVQAFARHRLAALASHPPSGLVEALRKCRDQFEFYVQAHLAKQPPDMDKAATNQEFVELCDAALKDHSHGG